MKLLNAFRRKALPTNTQTVFLDLPGSGMATNLEAYVREGFEGNPIVYACVNAIMKAVASVKLEVHSLDKQGKKRSVATSHKALDLLAKPNPLQSGKEFMQELVMWHRTAGEAFVLRLPESGPAVELYLLDPRKVGIEKRNGVVSAYTYGDGAEKNTYRVSIVDGTSQVLHIKTPNPDDPYRGLSPLKPGGRPTDIHNAGGKWNANLLANSARPSGIITLDGMPNEGVLSQMRAYFKRAWSGTANAGNVPLLTGGAKFEALSHNPKDMDFQSSMSESAKNIALVYGVPLPLVTMEASTFSNMETALERFWVDTVLPLLDEVLEAMSTFLGLQAGSTLAYNADSIPALEGKRARLYDRMGKAIDGLVTIDEARVEMGFEEIGGKAAELRVRGTLRPLDQADDPAADAVAALAKALEGFGYSPADAKAQAEGEVK